ncbi:MAG: tetratricopeptide repeat protein, partial [Ignavibacteria bacterium]|nr:tetratricopeptide repeat protein [Ignavibacteria bacterium]
MAKISPFFALDAVELFENGNYDDAIALCIEGIEQFPDYLTGYVTIIDLFIKIGNSQKAKEYLDKFKLISNNYKNYKQISEFEEILLSLEQVQDTSITDENKIIPGIEQAIEENTLNNILEAYQTELEDNQDNELELVDNKDNSFDEITANQSELQTEIELIDSISNELEISGIQQGLEELSSALTFKVNNQDESLEDNLIQEPDVEVDLKISDNAPLKSINLPKGFLKAFATTIIPADYHPSINVENKLLIDGLFDYLFYDFSSNKQYSNLEIEANFNINSIISKYEKKSNQEDEIQKLAERISNVSKIEISEPIEDEIEDESVDYIPPA